jgi:di/tricarboxylate transporter
MSPAALSLLALLLALGLSMVSRINVGFLGVAFAWVIGVYVAGMKPDAVMAGFPTSLFLTLTGVTLLFAIAETNRTLEALAHHAVRVAHGNARLIPILFFVMACALSSVGPGAVSTVALLAPLGMLIGARAGVSPVLTALMIANGANAGNLSPFSSVGVIANGAMAKAGLTGAEGRVWFANFAAHLIVAAAAYVWLAGRETGVGAAHGRRPAEGMHEGPPPRENDPARFGRSQRITMTLIALWITGVLIFNINLGLSAFAVSALLVILATADESAAVKRVPWAIIMMVCGVSVLIGLLEKTGGMDLFTDLLSRMGSARSIDGVIAFVTGAISTYSSTSGVVLPAFLPTAATLAQKVGSSNPLAIALSINVGSSLVDVSPLSTIGALCVAAVADPTVARHLFRVLLIWGLSMTLVGALLAQLFAPLVAAS